MKKSSPRVSLIAFTPDPQRVSTAAARLSYKEGNATDIFNSTPRGGQEDFLSRVVRMGHSSVIEHSSFTFAIENVSVLVEQFLIEFRLASFTVKSRRYVDYSEAGFIVPRILPEPELPLFPGLATSYPYIIPEIEEKGLYRRYISVMQFLFDTYRRLTKAGIPQEDARFVLPYSFKTNLFLTANTREMMNIISQAIYGRGKNFPEIRWVGKRLLEEMQKLIPCIFSNLGNLIEKPAEDDFIHKLSREHKLARSEDEKPTVELLSYTPDPERVVFTAAVMEKSIGDTERIKNLYTEEFFEKVLDSILCSRRERALEQASFSFRIGGISLPALTHIARHRMQSPVIPSLADVGKSENFVIPETIKKRKELLHLYKEAFRRSESLYKKFLASRVPKETAIYTYLSGNTTDIITTMNARELYHFFGLRTCNRAQWEIKVVADRMLVLVKGVAPVIFKKAGPRCIRLGYCPEGKKSCGKLDEVRKRYSEI